MSIAVMRTHHFSPITPKSRPAYRPRSSGTSAILPPSVCCGSPQRPNVELRQPVWEVDADNRCVITGELDVNISMFRRRPSGHIEPFSIGIAFSPVLDQADPEAPAEVEWNQDPGTPGNYYRWRSFIQISERLMVDESCHARFSIHIPPHMLQPEATRSGNNPPILPRRLFKVSVKAYELANPSTVTQTSDVQLMVLCRPEPLAAHGEEKAIAPLLEQPRARSAPPKLDTVRTRGLGAFCGVVLSCGRKGRGGESQRGFSLHLRQGANHGSGWIGL